MDEANKFTPDEAVAQITPEIPTDPEARLEYFKPLIQEALDECARVIAEIEDKKSRGEHVDITPFDARAKLYELAMALAGEARSGDIVAMLDFIKPQKGEVGVDVSAGTGFLTKSVSEVTDAATYAIDPSEKQLGFLRQNCSENVVPVRGWPDNEGQMFEQGGIPREGIDFATSFGGVHHINIDRYPEAFQNIADMLKPGGRFTAADVGGDTILQRHFDEVVTDKCLTGHEMGQFMSPEKLKELAEGAGLVLVSAGMKPLTWDFNSEEEMAWFFKGLHAYPQPVEEIIQDLRETLGVTEEDGKFKLNWPMLFWEIRKPE